MWLAETDLAIFTKMTLMNLCEFAENELQASHIVFLLSSNHRQKSQYKQMFKVIDAHRMGSTQVSAMLGLDDKDVARGMLDHSCFFELQL